MSKLRQLIRESITNYISEINEAGDISACESKILKTREAIELREKKISKEGIDEAYHDMLDENKLKEFAKEIKILEKSLAKHEKMLEKLKSKANKGEKVEDTEEKEIVDEVAIDENEGMEYEGMEYEEERFDEYGNQTDDGSYDAHGHLIDLDNEMMRAAYSRVDESFLHMQKLAGVITEAQYKAKKKSLIENQLNEDNLEVKSIAKKLYSWLKQNGVAASLATQNVNFKQIGIKDPKQQEATIYVFDDPSTKQTIIRVSLRGKESIVKDVENKLLTTYPGLEEFNKQQHKLYSGGLTNSQEIPGAINLTFDLKEKTTAKGGDINPNQRPNTPKPTV